MFCTRIVGRDGRSAAWPTTTLSRFDDAARHFEQAMEMNARIRSLLWVAHTQHDYAHMLLLRDRADDRDLAVELLEQALATAE